jgi:hypothetical protein
MTEWIAQPDAHNLTHKDPELRPGERRVIAMFQDESSFHVNEYRQTAWYAPLS